LFDPHKLAAVANAAAETATQSGKEHAEELRDSAKDATTDH
jgi:hypothetical protein